MKLKTFLYKCKYGTYELDINQYVTQPLHHYTRCSSGDLCPNLCNTSLFRNSFSIFKKTLNHLKIKHMTLDIIKIHKANFSYRAISNLPSKFHFSSNVAKMLECGGGAPWGLGEGTLNPSYMCWKQSINRL